MIFMHNGLSRQVSMVWSIGVCCLFFCQIHIQYIYTCWYTNTQTTASPPLTHSPVVYTRANPRYTKWEHTHWDVLYNESTLFCLFITIIFITVYFAGVILNLYYHLRHSYYFFSIITQFVFKMYTYSSIS